MRTKGASLAMATNWICNYAVVQATLPGIANLGYKFWIVWAVICFSFIFITYLFYPVCTPCGYDDKPVANADFAIYRRLQIAHWKI